MMFCQNCGAQLNEGTKFCPNCGTLVQTAGVQAGAPIQQEMPPAAVEPPVAEPTPTPTPAPAPAPAPTAVVEKETVPPVQAAPQPTPEPIPYQQAVPQPTPFQQAPPQPAPFRPAAPQQAPYQQAAPQQAPYQQAAPQPAPYQQAAPLQAPYQQPAPQPGMYQQPYAQPQVPPAQPPYQQPAQGYAPTEAQMKKGMAILSYFGILVLIPIFAAKNDPFARYHANQGLVLFILLTVCSVLSNVLTNILYDISPVLVLVVSGLFGLLTFVFCIFALIGIIRAAKGQMKPLPIIGGIKILK